MFWYAAAAALGRVGYGSVFLAVGLYIRNPIIPAAVRILCGGSCPAPDDERKEREERKERFWKEIFAAFAAFAFYRGAP